MSAADDDRSLAQTLPTCTPPSLTPMLRPPTVDSGYPTTVFCFSVSPPSHPFTPSPGRFTWLWWRQQHLLLLVSLHRQHLHSVFLSRIPNQLLLSPHQNAAVSPTISSCSFIATCYEGGSGCAGCAGCDGSGGFSGSISCSSFSSPYSFSSYIACSSSSSTPCSFLLHPQAAPPQPPPDPYRSINSLLQISFLRGLLSQPYPETSASFSG